MSVDIQKGYDKAFDNVLRLRIMSILMVNARYDFNSFKALLQVTDGNLASHLKHLEQAEFLLVEKSFAGRKPLTTYGTTEKGRRAFQAHLGFLEQLIRQNKAS
ncbi:MAG: transcriptional regulator [Algoriphagus sp.]|jgi:DNA-binding HxlR family transcriptional regulator|nr:transcriptional regulator [Algoriphagus sp.]MCE2779884.1 transcriptional regulator [Algoriphagus sp.]